jgi:hypothetical protein
MLNAFSGDIRFRFADPIPTKSKPIVIVMMAAEDRGPLMHADIGMKRALNAGKPVEFDPKQKSPHWGNGS